MVGEGLTCPKGMKFKKWTIPGLFFIYFCLFKQTLQIYVKNVMSIHYTAPGFEPTTFGT